MNQHKQPSQEWNIHVRPAGLDVYGEEWLDWELLIDFMVTQTNWTHPSSHGEACGWWWVINDRLGQATEVMIDMRVPNWEVITSPSFTRLKNPPQKLLTYKLLML